MSGWAALGQIADTGLKIYGDHANRKSQKKFAREGITWKVNDAKRAGIHPLAALGANTMSFSPQYIDSDLGAAGQNIDRAIQAGKDKQLRSLELRLKKAQVSAAESEALMRAEDVKDRQSNISNGVQSVIEKPHEQTMAIDTHGAVAAGSSPSVSFYPTATKGIGSALSKDLKEVLEDSPEELVESIKRAILNMTGSTAYKPPRSYWKKFYPDAVDVEFKFKSWDYQPVYQKGNRTRKYKKTKGGGGF